MFIILKKEQENEQVANVLYTDNINIVYNWISKTIMDEIESLMLCPLRKGERDVTCVSIDNIDGMSLVRRYKKLHKGYIYNVYDNIEEEVFSLRFLEYDGMSKSVDSGDFKMWKSINDEINGRILKQLDRDSLYKIMSTVQIVINTKDTWTGAEYTGIVSEAIRDFKKQLYENVKKRIKRFNKFKTGACRLEAKKKLD
jgi:hypothetical protein